MRKQTEVIIDAASWPGRAVPSDIAAVAGRRTVSTLLALLFTAQCTRPPTVTGFHLSDFWAWLRYSFAFDTRPGLRLCREWDNVDTHQKTVLSDELGVGFVTQFLAEHFGCRQFVDAVHFVKVLNPGLFALGKSKKRGPEKSPDYIAIDPTGRYWILECKGTQTSRKALGRQLAAGKVQKENVTAIGPAVDVAHSLVAGLFIPQYSNTARSCIRVADPTWPEITRVLGQSERGHVDEAITQVGLAKELALSGFVESAGMLGSTPLTGRRELSPRAKDEIRRRRDRGANRPLFDTNVLFRDSGASMSRGRARFYATPPEPVVEMLLGENSLDESVRTASERTRKGEWKMDATEHSAEVETPLGFRFRIVVDLDHPA